MKFLPIATSLLIAGSLATATSTSSTEKSSISARNGSKAARAVAHEAYEKRFPEVKKRCSKKKSGSSSSSGSSTSSSSGAQSTGSTSKSKSGSKGSGSNSSSSSSGDDSSSGSSNGSNSNSDSNSAGSKSGGSSSGSKSGGQSSGSGSGDGSGSSSGNSNSSGSNNAGSNGKISSMTDSCGSSDASGDNPNGSKSWLNCGINSGGWKPPNVKLSDLKIISDDEAASASVFQPCKKYASEFKSASSSTGIPVAVLMSIAMQESTCNPNANGSRGEVGMMQITPDKCGGAPGGNCHDATFNIKKGGQYLKDTMDQFGGNFVEALGQYNGWEKGMKGSGSCGPAGQNLAYLNSNLNHYFQGKQPSENGSC